MDRGHGPFDALNGGRGDPGSLGYRTDGETFPERLLNLASTFQREVGSAELNAVGTSACEAGVDPAGDDRALKLGEHGQHLEEHPAAGRRGIDRLLVEIEVATPGLDVGQEGHQIGQGASQTIDGEGGDHIDLSTMDGLHKGIEAWTLVPALGATDAGVREDLDDGPARSFGDLMEDSMLVLGRLRILADAEVKTCSFHLRDDLTDRQDVNQNYGAAWRF